MPTRLVHDKDHEFYSMVGPYLASRSVSKEIGYHIYDDDKTQWVITTERKELVAFALFRVVGHVATVTSCYTVERYRRKGFMKQLIKFAVYNIHAKVFRASANKNSLHMFKSLGFKKVRENGRFTVVEYHDA